MDIFENMGTKAYTNDMDVIQILRNIPPIKELSNKSILKFLEENTAKKDLLLSFGHNGDIYTVLKFDVARHEDSGLVLLVSPETNVDGQIAFLDLCKGKGGAIDDKSLDTVIERLRFISTAVQLEETFKHILNPRHD